MGLMQSIGAGKRPVNAPRKFSATPEMATEARPSGLMPAIEDVETDEAAGGLMARVSLRKPLPQKRAKPRGMMDFGA